MAQRSAGFEEVFEDEDVRSVSADTAAEIVEHRADGGQ